MARLIISVFCTLAVPILLVPAYSLWHKDRHQVPHWRNGAGLASITFIVVSWSLQLFDLVRVLDRVNWQPSQNFEWYSGSIELYFLPLGPLLALAFRGLTRLQVLPAGLLVWELAASLTYS